MGNLVRETHKIQLNQPGLNEHTCYYLWTYLARAT